MKNKKVEKLLVKSVIGGLFTFAIGVVYKIGERTAAQLDDKYEKEHGVPQKLFGGN